MGSRVLRAPVTLEDHALGHFGASITLVQYGDYECPGALAARDFVVSLQHELHGDLLFVFRHFPLTHLHPHAFVASATAEAADAQGEFWSMHHLLLDHPQALDLGNLRRYAIGLGLDLDRFELDRTSATVAERIHRDIESGRRSGVEDTPTFFVNGMSPRGIVDLAPLRSAILRLSS